jgi:hypothetical protein
MQDQRLLGNSGIITYWKHPKKEMINLPGGTRTHDHLLRRHGVFGDLDRINLEANSRKNQPNSRTSQGVTLFPTCPSGTCPHYIMLDHWTTMS